MAGIATPNVPTFVQGNSGDRAPITGTSFSGGVNRGASNMPGIGINTGDYDPKVTDWSRHVRNPIRVSPPGATEVFVLIERPAGTFTETCAFVQAAAETAPDGNLIAGPPAVVNRTGKTVPANSWAWGSRAQS